MNQNPLLKYFRQPKIYIGLPSNGKFYPEGTIDMPPNGELPIYPMTAADEMKARTPDALFNGAAIADVIASCVPNIKNTWKMPVVDMNALLAAIRLASYGNDMEVATTCPSCKHTDIKMIDLRTVLNNFNTVDYSEPLTIGDLQLYFKPIDYEMLNNINRANFNNQKNIDLALSNNEISEEERALYLGNTYREIADLTFKSMANSIQSVKGPDCLVTDTAQIEEFLINSPKEIYDTIKEYGINLRESANLKPIPMICPNCEHEYDQEFTLDISNFFETAS